MLALLGSIFLLPNCAKTSVAPNYLVWERGHQLGLKQYCTTNNAYNIGRLGRQLNNVCPLTLANTVQTANQKGLDYYKQSQAPYEYHTKTIKSSKPVK